MARNVLSAHVGPRATLTLPRGVTMTYRDGPECSTDEPVILLHGVGVTADLNWGATYAALHRHFRVVAPDLPGHGHNSRPWAKFSIEKCADHIVELADSLGVDSFIACGYSMGSLVAQELWRSHRDRISGLVLCATSRNFLGSSAERMVSSLSPVFSAAARANPLLRMLPADAFGLGYLNDLDAESRAYVHAEMGLTSMATVAAAIAAVGEFTSHDWVGEIDVPVAVLVTTRDSVVPTGRQRKLADALPHATVVEAEGDHGVFIESPGLFAQKVLEACLAVKV
ncbi:alpha/beta fold hydrolase [Mycolicibacterium sp.]|uniref:alpha/beta fold hydrolase n=1 Tax=Mycolicibacterium sp. TaxID=2320850 RepID=UPI0037C8DBDF